MCRPVEVLRKESLAGLAPSAACRVLSHAYAAVVPITPLPYPPLPLSPNTPGKSPHLPPPPPLAPLYLSLLPFPNNPGTQLCYEYSLQRKHAL